MFKKPIRVKSNNRLKGSERKRLKQTILAQFSNVSDDQLQIILPSKEDVFVSKIETQNGIFVTSYSVKNNPLFFEVDKEKILYPTVYTLWEIIDLIPYMVTWPNVFEKISRGADLMLPGVVSRYGGYENISKGQVMAVRLAGNRAAVAVGVAAMSSNEMAETGMKGKGILINHCYMDTLWSSGDSTEMPLMPDSMPFNSDEDALNNLLENDFADKVGITDSVVIGDGSVDERKKDTDILATDLGPSQDENMSSDLPNDEKNIELDEKVVCVENPSSHGDEVDLESNEKDVQPEIHLATAEEQMDELLENCFFQALIDAKKIELPILASTFSTRFLHAACPQGQKIDVKKSRYKKMGRFLQEMENKQLIKTAELSKGVLSIMEINSQNEILKEFKSTDFARAKSLAKAEELAERESHVASQGIDVIELFAVSGKTQTFFKQMGYSKGQMFVSSDIRKILTKYIKDNELVNEKNRRLVVLDPLLTDSLLDKNENHQSMAWDAVFERCVSRMNPCHRVIINGKEMPVRKGRIENVEVKIEQRMGNKKVTLVKNLEQFGVDPNEFANQVQHIAASSTTVSSLPGKNAAGLQVLIQGNQTSHVAKLLDEMKIPKKYINGLEKLKSKGKKR